MPKNDENDVDFTSELLFHACALRCNPSSTFQILMRGARDSGEHFKQMKAEKSYCLRGCRNSADDLANANVDDLLKPSIHADVLDTAGKREVIVSSVGKLRSLKHAAGVRCTTDCKTAKNPKTCLKECAAGTTEFFKLLSDLF
eukprot:CAMPEP_0197520864 /NCGR_PEP_ID=MMETSP1318-20131121/6195_1 /TAXON_ID=552666 /ORGANISM="Partenskyella glossopodia, Strain RCC365" /LENGTH=142 /DNA_ID=CAMNT_0043072621 /DNA_START=63 /DNA_END=491 /DNA_ORIENTATION=-